MTDAERARRYRARRKRGRSLEQRFDAAVHALENLWSALLDAGTVADTKDLRDAGTGYPVRRELCRAPSGRPRDRFAGANERSLPP